MVIEVRSNRMPGGGFVITFSDVTPSFEAAEALERANATLEKRVRDRTEELTRLNSELARAKSNINEEGIEEACGSHHDYGTGATPDGTGRRPGHPAED